MVENKMITTQCDLTEDPLAICLMAKKAPQLKFSYVNNQNSPVVSSKKVHFESGQVLAFDLGTTFSSRDSKSKGELSPRLLSLTKVVWPKA